MTLRDGEFLRIPLYEPMETHPKLLQTVGAFRWRDHKRLLLIPEGFVFDGASIPNMLYPLLSASPIQLLLAGLAHDACYRSDCRVYGPGGLRYTPDRYDADKVLSKICGQLDVIWSDRKKIFYGVRVGGAGSYHQHTMAWRGEK